MGSFGVCLALALILAIFELTRRPLEPGVFRGRLRLAGLVLIAIGLIGSRLAAVIVAGVPSSQWPIEAVSVTAPGRVLYGGLLLASLALPAVAHWLGLPLRTTADRVALASLVGIAVGRIGCFLVGDDHGRLAETAAGEPALPWAVRFVDENAAIAPEWLGRWLHPAQLYHAATALALYGMLRWWQTKRPSAGHLFLAAMLGHASLRFWLESYRGDPDRGFLGGPGWQLSTSQWLAIALVTWAIVLGRAWTKRTGETSKG